MAYDRIAVALADSPSAVDALLYALRLAEAHSAQLHVVSVVPDAVPEQIEAVRNRTPLTGLQELKFGRRALVQLLRMEALQDELLSGVPSCMDITTHLVGGRVPATLCEVARTLRVDVLIMGTKTRSSLERFLEGSVTETVIRQCSVPVLSLRRGSGDDPHPRSIPCVFRRVCLLLGREIVTATHTRAVLGALRSPDLSQIEVVVVSALEPSSETLGIVFETAELLGIQTLLGNVCITDGTSIASEVALLAAKGDFDLILAPTARSMSIFGSDSENLLRTVTTPLMVVNLSNVQACCEPLKQIRSPKPKKKS